MVHRYVPKRKKKERRKGEEKGRGERQKRRKKEEEEGRIGSNGEDEDEKEGRRGGGGGGGEEEETYPSAVCGGQRWKAMGFVHLAVRVCVAGLMKFFLYGPVSSKWVRPCIGSRPVNTSCYRPVWAKRSYKT